MLDFAVHDPVRHRVDVVADNVATDPVGLNEGRAATHEWVGDGDSLQVVGGVEGFPERPISEFGEDQPAKQRAWSPGEPLMNGDDRAVVLLDLFFPQGEGGDKGDVEMFFYGHGEVIVCFRGICNLLLYSCGARHTGEVEGPRMRAFLVEQRNNGGFVNV